MRHTLNVYLFTCIIGSTVAIYIPQDCLAGRMFAGWRAGLLQRGAGWLVSSFHFYHDIQENPDPQQAGGLYIRFLKGGRGLGENVYPVLLLHTVSTVKSRLQGGTVVTV